MSDSDRASTDELEQALDELMTELEASLASARTALRDHGARAAAEDLLDSIEDIEAGFKRLGLAMRTSS
jgi:hypothetical protein